MAKKSEYFEHESLQDRESLVNYLKALTKAIEKGEIILSDDEITQIIQTESMATMMIKARKTKKQQQLKLQFCWANDPDDEGDDTPLFIRAQKPKAKSKSKSKK